MEGSIWNKKHMTWSEQRICSHGVIESLRFWNDDVMKNIDRVVEVIVEELEMPPWLRPNSSQSGGERKGNQPKLGETKLVPKHSGGYPSKYPDGHMYLKTFGGN